MSELASPCVSEPASILDLMSPDCVAVPSPGVQRSSKYYIEDEMSIFLVENQLFKVHRYFLVKESEVFLWMFTCPPGANKPDGSGEECAITLPGVTSREFEALLDFFYTETFQRYRARMQEWIHLLAISTRFDFQRLRELAIEAIELSRWPQPSYSGKRKGSKGQPSSSGNTIKIDPIEQIVLAEQHDIPHWLRIAYVAICERSKPLEEWEARKIGYEKTILLARAREAVRNPHHIIPSPPTSPAGRLSPIDFAIETPRAQSLDDNGFYHNRRRVQVIVDEVFFPTKSSSPEFEVSA